MISKNIASGLNRYFDFEKWQCCPKEICKKSGKRRRCIRLKNAEPAGVADCIHFQKLCFYQSFGNNREAMSLKYFFSLIY